MHPLVEQAEALFGSDMERLASDMQKRFPEFRFNLWRGPVGSLTEYQGYDIGVECVFQTIGPHDSVSVSLSVELCHLTSTPKVMATVNWDPASAHPGKQFRD